MTNKIESNKKVLANVLTTLIIAAVAGIGALLTGMAFEWAICDALALPLDRWTVGTIGNVAYGITLMTLMTAEDALDFVGISEYIASKLK